MFSKTLKMGLVLTLAFSSLSLTSCKGRVAPQVEAKQETTTPGNNFLDNTGGGGFNENTTPTTPTITAVANPSLGSTPLGTWQAKGVAVSGNVVFASAVGKTKLVFTSGTVLKIEGGKFKDFATTLTYHPIASTVQGIAFGGGKLFVADSGSYIYSVDPSSGKVTSVKSAPSKDIAVAGGNVFVANGSVEKADSTMKTRSAVAGLTSSGGIGADNTGNVFAVNGSKVQKLGPSDTQPMDVITTDISGGIDVAVDNRNGDLYVLEQQNIKRFNSSGSLMVSFPSTATAPVAIALDDAGNIYVADSGTAGTKDSSKIIKFGPGNLS